MKPFFTSVCIVMMLLCAVPVQAVRLKIATVSPEGSFWMTRMREAAEEISSKTAGRVTLKFYPGGVMGDDQSVLKKIRIGQLHGAALMTGSLTEVYPYMQIYGFPLKFKSFAEVDYVRQRMDAGILEGLKKGGYMAFGPAEGGFAYFMSKFPVKTVEDLQQRKMWIPNDDPTVIDGVSAFDMKPTPLAFADVRSGLQTDLIDTVATSPIGALALQWHTQIKYVTNLPFMYICAMFIIDQGAYSQISATDEPVVTEILKRMFAEIDHQNRKDNLDAMEALKKQGITFIDPPETAMPEWKRRADRVRDELLKSGRFTPEIVNTLETHIAASRQG